jgi:hypothetical protein
MGGLLRFAFCVFGSILLFASSAQAEETGDDPEKLPSEIKAETLPNPGGPGGMERGGGMGGPGMGGGPPGYELFWYPRQDVKSQRADLGFVRQGISIGAPVWRNETDSLMASLGVRNTLFDTEAILPDTRRGFPDQLWNLNFGLTYMRRFENGWSGGFITGFGSASDKPFRSIDEITANLGGFLRIPAKNGRDAWQFSLFYMYGGALNFPIPGIAYTWNPSEQLRVNLGIPFSVFWQPSEEWTLNLSYMPLLNINARVTYRFAPDWQLFTGYEFVNESYFLTGRTDQQDRFFVLEQRIITGIRWDVGPKLTLEGNCGYSFGRFFGEGQSPFDSLKDRVDLDPGPFVGLRLQLRF